MKKQLVILTSLILISIFLFPGILKAQEKSQNKKKIKAEELYGKWKAVQVEALNAPTFEETKTPAVPTDTTKKVSNPGRPARTPEKIAQRQKTDFENFLKNEAKSTLEILPNKTAIRTFNNKTTAYTWKLKKNTLTAKDPVTKYKYKIFIRKWTPEYLDIEETTKTGNVKVRVLYERVK